jgi:hypothetical protein
MTLLADQHHLNKDVLQIEWRLRTKVCIQPLRITAQDSSFIFISLICIKAFETILHHYGRNSMKQKIKMMELNVFQIIVQSIQANDLSILLSCGLSDMEIM